MIQAANELEKLRSSENLEEGYETLILTLISQALTAGGRTGLKKGQFEGFEPTPFGKLMALGLKKIKLIWGCFVFRFWMVNSRGLENNFSMFKLLNCPVGKSSAWSISSSG